MARNKAGHELRCDRHGRQEPNTGWRVTGRTAHGFCATQSERREQGAAYVSRAELLRIGNGHLPDGRLDEGYDVVEETDETGAKISCIAYPSTVFDDDMECFGEEASRTTAYAGPLTEDCISNTFSVSWKAIPPLTIREFSLTPHFTDGIQKGVLTVRYPYILVRGRTLCDKIRALLPPHKLAKDLK